LAASWLRLEGCLANALLIPQAYTAIESIAIMAKYEK
jgi:hypothetical protein